MEDANQAEPQQSLVTDKAPELGYHTCFFPMGNILEDFPFPKPSNVGYCMLNF